MDRWLGVFAIVVGAALFIWGPDDVGVKAGQWVLWVGGVVFLVFQPTTYVVRRLAARGSRARLKAKGKGHMARQTLKDQTPNATPLFPPRNGDFVYADFEASGDTAVNVRAWVTVKRDGKEVFGPTPTLWAGSDSDAITLKPGDVGSSNSVWKPFGSDAAFPVTVEALRANPMSWTQGTNRLEAGRYEVMIEAKGDNTNKARLKFEFTHEGTDRPTAPKQAL